MKICEWCGKSFDPEEANEYFSLDAGIFSYDKIRKCLCGECAVKAIEDKIEGVYYETCEQCGRTFDVVEEESDFDSHFSWANGTNLYDYWHNQILCAECALNVDLTKGQDEEDDEDDEDDSERLSVYEAAEIWASHGKDEDYTFGYSEDELEDAL